MSTRTLREFFREHPAAALGFSGGVDSSYLLWTALKCSVKVGAYFVKSPFQPQSELDDAIRVAKLVGAELTIIEYDVLADPRVADNPADRCYYCKKGIFTAVAKQAAADGFNTLIDGTNASDDAGDRPGMRALAELEVRSPLRECGLTKSEIRRLSREAGLPTWDKPAYACLATRIPTGTPVTRERLEKTERAETALSELGFTDFRVRMTKEGDARIQVPEAQLAKLIENRNTVLGRLKPDYRSVLLDLEGR